MSDQWPLFFRALEVSPPAPRTVAATLLENMPADRDARAIAWYVYYAGIGYSSFRLAHGLRYIADGYDDVYTVRQIRRGSQPPWARAPRPGLAIAVRPATTGRYSKPSVDRVDVARGLIDDLTEDLLDRAAMFVRFCCAHSDCRNHPDLALACRQARYPQRDPRRVRRVRREMRG